MELRNWEFNTTGSAIAGADVFVYEASLTHPNAGSILASTTTNSDGMWAFTGLTDTAKDVKVEYQSKAKWYKGLTKHSVGIVFIDDYPTSDYVQLLGQGSAPSDPAAGIARLWFDSASGNPKFKYGNGTVVEIATYEGADSGEVLRAGGWGNVATGDVAANAISQVTTASLSTSGPSTTSTSFVTVPELEVTVTPASVGSLLLVIAELTHTNDTAGAVNEFGLNIDGGANTFNRSVTIGTAGYLHTNQFHIAFTGLSAAAHTLAFRWLTSAGTMSSQVQRRSLTVIEFKK